MAEGGSRFFLGQTTDTGSLKRVRFGDSGEANNTSTTSNHGTTGGTTVRRVVPMGPSTANAVPASPSTPANSGWKMTAADMGAGPTFVRSVITGTWNVTLVANFSALGSGQILAILYRVGGSSPTEIGRSAFVNVPGVTAASMTIPIPSVPAQTWDETTETFQVELYVSAPAVAVTGNSIVIAIGASQSYIDLPAVIKTISTETGGAAVPGVGGTEGGAAIKSYSQRVLEDSPAVYYKAEDSVGATSLDDASANNRDGSLFNNTALGIAGVRNNAVEIGNSSGAAGYIQIPYVIPSATQELTFVGYTRPLTNNLHQMIVSGDQALNSLAFYRSVNVGEVGRVYFLPGGGSNVFWDGDVLPVGAFHHYALVVKPGVSAELFVNSVSQGVKTLTVNLVPNGTVLFVNIQSGGVNQGWSYYDEYAIIPSALTASRIAQYYDAPTNPGTAGFGKQVQVDKLGGGISPRVGGGPKKIEYADTGGAASPRSGGGPKKVDYADTGGGVSSRSGGGPKKIEVADTGGALAPGVAGGARKTETRKAGGAAEVGVGGGAKKIEVADTGGAASARSGGGPKVLQVVRAGGGLRPSVGGGSKVAQVIRAGGARLVAFAGGARQTTLARVGGALAAMFAGGGKTAERRGAGGAASPRVGGGTKVTQVVRAGGGLKPAVGGGTKALGVVRAGGGIFAPMGGGGLKLVIAREGSAAMAAVGGGQKAVVAARSGGAASPSVGGAVQYSVYTFAIRGITRDKTGAVVIGAKVACFRTDTYSLINNNPIQTSDLIDGSFAFRVSNPDVDPTTYWVSMRKAGTPNIMGRTDEDLVPEVQLVQGGE